MKKIVLLFALFALMSQTVDAKVITVDQAKAVAQQQLAKTTKLIAPNAKMTLSYSAMSMKGAADYYIFNREGGQGFVIVAGDDLSTPVLGYSTTGSFDMNEAPEPLKLMLKDYQVRMEWLRLHPEAAKGQSIKYDLQPYGVYPICGEVHWHQFPPYNNNAPRSSHALTSNGRCYAGCVPVAFSTIMKGLKYPSRGFGEFGYNYMLDGQEVTAFAKFNDYTYNYSKMYNGYGEYASNAQAVSELVYEVGVAFHTIYSGESSDALVRNVFRGMIAFFDFNSNIQYLQKNSYEYNVQAWYDIMYNEIDNGRPIYYTGRRTIDNSGNPCNIGHAFVLDGYDSNGKVHVNWGFQPEAYNTYFDWELLSPRSDYEYNAYDSGFNHEQAAIIGICPDTTGIGGVLVKNVNLVADTMPATDLRATIDIQSLSGIWNGTLKYGIVSKGSDGKYSAVYTATANVQIDEDYGIATLDLSGSYPYYLYDGRTYYIVVYSPYFANSTDPSWMWFLDDPVPFTVGDWPVEPIQPGDVDGNGLIEMDDLTKLINYLLTGDMTGIDPVGANVNETGEIDMDDLTALINILLQG